MNTKSSGKPDEYATSQQVASAATSRSVTSAEQSFQITPPSITLPKGGGAIRGIGEKFAANPVTGTVSMTVPIVTSPGRSGFGPQFSLTYDSGAGNGSFGLGWNLALPSITRKTDQGLPMYQDAVESDVFILSGAEDLVPEFEKDAAGNWIVKDGKHVIHDKPRTVDGVEYRVRRYCPRIEGLFARIERWTDANGVSHWRSISKDNIITLYGSTDESRIVDPSDETRIFSWLICESFDDKGNAIRYEYKKENSQGIDRSSAHEANRQDTLRTANRYLKRIKYGNKNPRQAGENLSARQDWMFEVVLDYGEHYVEDAGGKVRTVDCADNMPQPNPREWKLRLDPFSSYRAAFEVRTYRLCRRVLMFHHYFDELGIPDYLISATHFAYDETAVASFITGVTQSGYKRIAGTYRKKSLPPVEFDYSQAVIQEKVCEVDAASLENLPQGLDNSRYLWADLDGEGLSGILTEQGSAWFYKRNQSAVPVKDPAGKETTVARFAPLERVATMPSSANLSGGQQLLDLAGDGQLDVVDFDGPTPGFFERTPDEEWDTHKPFTSLPNLAWHDPNLKFIDLTGDGHADILMTEDEAFSWYPSLAEAGFGSAENVRQAIDEEHGPRLVFADGTQSIYLADMSGDGLTDLMRIRNGEVCYWPNLGYGRFGAKVTMDKAPWFDAPDMFDQHRIRLADIDGSGLVDILYLASQGVQLYFNQSGNGWSERRILSTFPRIDKLSAVSTVDLLGNGTACLVWSSPLPGDARSTIRYIDLMGGQKPHLLIKTTNNLGGETEVTYAPSTKFYLQDKQAGTPWITKLPFPVHCVEKVTVRDKWRKTEFASTYSYHHGYFDGIEREFRGFGRVEQRDVETYGKFMQGNIASPYITDQHDLYQPPIKTVTWYHVGAAFERDRILSALKHEYFSIPGFTEHQFPEPTLTPADLSAEEWREALRACKGMVLRQEVFELDVDALDQGTELPVRLYTTAYHNSNITRRQPQGINCHAVFLVTESEAITYTYELDLRQTAPSPDPRMAHTLNLRFDAYGRALQSVAVVYPRLAPYADSSNILTMKQRDLIHKVQSERHIAYTETHVTAELPEDPDRHRLPAPCEVLTYELSGTDSTNGFVPSVGLYFSLDDLKAFSLSDTLLDQGGKTVVPLAYHEQPTGDKERAHRRIVEWVRMLYFKDDLSGPLDFGQPSRLGLIYETYKLALTEVLLTDVLMEKFDADVRATLNKGSTSVWPLAQTGFLASGYQTDSELFHTNAPARQWWMRSGVAGYAGDAADHFYLPEKYTDPFGNSTTLRYDPLDLYVRSSSDALGNTTSITSFDYRVLAPIEMVDPNGNRAEVYFDILGMVVASALKGKGDEADDLIYFDDDLANPPAAEVQAFCIDSEMDVQQASDWLKNATARFVYHFGETRDVNGNVTDRATRPAGACGIVRERHASQVALDPAHENPLQVVLDCSDGSGNVLMKKVQAEPDSTLPIADQKSRWIINGLTVLNNKGKPVKQYEPNFSKIGFGCELPPAEGVTPVMYYDAVGRVVRTEMPDGTFSRVEFSPWHVKSFDANDTVLEQGNSWYGANSAATASSEDQRAAQLATAHANTPTQVHLDSLGREVIAIAHNRMKDTAGNWQDEKYLTFTKLDAEGKPLWIRDARGNLVMQYITPPKANNEPSDAMPVNSVPCYDIAGNLLFQHSMDAGDHWMLMDAAGKPMRAWDLNDKGTGSATQEHFYRIDYDVLHRPTVQWLTIEDADPALIEAFKYCDTDQPNIVAGLGDAKERNLIGQAIEHWDSSGLEMVERIDLSGKPAHISRSLIKPDANGDTGVLDWYVADRDSLLERETFHKLTEYDALGRMTTLYNWHRDITFDLDGTQQNTPGSTNRVAVYVPEYNERGALRSEWLHVRASKVTAPDGTPRFTADPAGSKQAIAHISYNEKGQKIILALGNGTTTTYSYNDKTFRLTSLVTVRAITPGGMQNLSYTYDPVGNITHIHDAAQETVWSHNTEIRPEHHYVYDAIYRLIDATGRENPNPDEPLGNSEGTWPQVLFPSSDQPRNYTQRYSYDEVGNFVAMQHVPSNGNGWTRRYDTHLDSNRLHRTWYGAPDWDHAAPAQRTEYSHDTHGNMLNLNQTPEDWGLDIRWDWHDMILGFDGIGGGIARYHYGIDKQRTRKHIRRIGGAVEDRLYLGGYELYRRRNSQGDIVEEIESLHLLEGEQRVLLVDDVWKTDRTHANGTAYKTKPIYRYQYSNHLGSVCLELDDQAEIISYEEYHPYGTSAYRAMKSRIEAPPKRYRYTGMERDEESGLSYHGARYLSCAFGRWLSVDPSGIIDGVNLYRYVKNNPASNSDSGGRQTVGTMRGLARVARRDLGQKQRLLSDMAHYPEQYPTVTEETRAALRSEINALEKEAGKWEARADERTDFHKNVGLPTVAAAAVLAGGAPAVAVTGGSAALASSLYGGVAIGGALGAGRQGAEILDGTRQSFSPLEAVEGAGWGGALGPAAWAYGPVRIGLTMSGVASGASELSKKHLATGVFDIATSLLPVAIARSRKAKVSKVGGSNGQGQEQGPWVPKTRQQLVQAIQEIFIAAYDQARSEGLTNKNNELGNRAHELIRPMIEALDRVLRQSKGQDDALLGAFAEQFKQVVKDSTTGAEGLAIGIARTEGSKGLDVVLYRNGEAFLGIDLKTGRFWSPSEKAQITFGFMIPILQIQVGTSNSVTTFKTH